MRCTRALALTFILGLVIPAAAQNAQKPDLASAEAFVRGIYDRYKGDDPNLNFAGKDGEDLLSLSLLALVRKENTLLKQSGEGLGAMEADPICDCQDPGELKVLSVSLNKEGSHRVRATIIFNEQWAKPDSLDLYLVQSNGGWKIDDIKFQNGATWKEILKDGIAHGY
jgi:hypothetical protein